MSGRYYLGVDGGQSSTTALICDESGRIVGAGRAGPCNHITGEEAVQKFERVIATCIAAACEEAGLNASNTQFAAACLGLSGGPEDKDAHVRRIVPSDRYKVTHDAEIALAGATAAEPGIIVIAGTGSIAFGRNSDGVTCRAGGWGYIFGDEGGAFDIVRRALRAALSFEEGWGPPTNLVGVFNKAVPVPSMNEVLHLFYTPEYPRSRVAALAELVDRCALNSDVVACQVLTDAAHQLTRYVQGVHRKLFPSANVPVAPIGSVFQSTILRRAFEANVRDNLHSHVIAPRFSPAEGALIEALRLDGRNDAIPNRTSN